MTQDKLIKELITLLQGNIAGFSLPLVDQIIEEFGHDPYLILISCLLSLRVKDLTTIHVCRDLFTRARTPQAMLKIDRLSLEKIVFRTGFYRNKARVVHDVSSILLTEYDGKVPSTMEELLAIKGVGAKTANLVLGLAFKKPSICVDTHVHRISNRLGLIKTTTVEQTHDALIALLPQKYWIEWNTLLVIWGQNVCVPISPKCSQCAVNHLCKKVGVMKRR